MMAKLIPPAAEAGADVAESLSVIGKGIDKWKTATTEEKNDLMKDIGKDLLKVVTGAPLWSKLLPGDNDILTTGQQEVQRESQRRADLGMSELSWLEKHIIGPLPSSIAEANLKQFGPLFAGVHTPKQSLERIGGFDSAQMKQFTERQAATQPNFNITITATDREGILAELLSKVDSALRDSQSQGPVVS